MAIFSIEEKYLNNTIDLGRQIGESVVYFSIPRDFTGMRIEPGTVIYNFTGSDGINSGSIVDLGNGRLVLQSIQTVVGGVEVGSTVGDIIYPHGLIIITEEGTSGTFYQFISGSENYDLTWKSNHPIYTANYLCKVSDYEFNNTLNPSAIISGSEGVYIDQVTGSEFRPYITTVGLYNDANELIAVGKFGQPIPKSSNVDMTFVIKLDY